MMLVVVTVVVETDPRVGGCGGHIYNEMSRRYRQKPVAPRAWILQGPETRGPQRARKTGGRRSLLDDSRILLIKILVALASQGPFAYSTLPPLLRLLALPKGKARARSDVSTPGTPAILGTFVRRRGRFTKIVKFTSVALPHHPQPSSSRWRCFDTFNTDWIEIQGMKGRRTSIPPFPHLLYTTSSNSRHV